MKKEDSSGECYCKRIFQLPPVTPVVCREYRCARWRIEKRKQDEEFLERTEKKADKTSF